MQLKDKVFRQAKAAELQELFDEYKELRRVVKNKIDSAKNSYISIKISLATSSKKLRG